VKARRISWIGHVERIEDSRMPRRVMREKMYTTRRRGRPKIRRLDYVLDLRMMERESPGQKQHRRPRLMKGCRAKWWLLWWYF
jgi:hypothetical protein